MYVTDKGMHPRSRPLTWVNGTTVPVDLSFAMGTVGRMRAAVVREVIIEGTFDLTGGAAGLVAADACRLISRCVIRDAGGEIYNLTGTLIREDMIHELGERGSYLMDQGGALANTVQNANYHLEWRIPWDLEQSRDGSDTALPLTHLASASAGIDITFGTPPGVTVNSGSVTVYFHVHDEVVRELKSRYIRRMIAVNQAEDDYRWRGSTRWAILTSSPAATGQSNWTPTTYPTIIVPELEYNAISTRHLRDEYARCRRDRSASDPVTTSTVNAIPLIWSSSGQRIDKLPDIKSLRIQLPAAAPTSPFLYVGFIEDRHPALAAEWLGIDDVNQMIDEANRNGMVKLAGQGLVHHSVVGDIARRLPMVVPRGE